MLRSRLIAAVAAPCLAVAAAGAVAQAFEPFVVKDIRVEGLQRTEAGTVFSYLPVKVGETMNEEKAQRALRALFATGFFRDVRLEVENDVLVVLVQERPAIAQIDFVGMKEFEPDDGAQGAARAGLAEGRIFDRVGARPRRAGAEAPVPVARHVRRRGADHGDAARAQPRRHQHRRQRGRGRQDPRHQHRRRPGLPRERAARRSSRCARPGWLTWYTKHDQYSAREAGAPTSRRCAPTTRTAATSTSPSTRRRSRSRPTGSDIYITVNITEGEKYTVSRRPARRPDAAAARGAGEAGAAQGRATCSRARSSTDSTKAITDRLGNDGYAFANVNAVPSSTRRSARSRSPSWSIPGRRVYVRRINVAGNTKTRDEVVRREMRQLEGAYYDASKIQLSRRRIDRTQYFNDVTVETRAGGGQHRPGRRHCHASRRGRPARCCSASASPAWRRSRCRARSRRRTSSAAASSSRPTSTAAASTQVYSLSYLDPYYTVDGVSRGFDVYKRKTDASSLAVGAYATDAVGGGVKFGYPVSRDRRGRLRPQRWRRSSSQIFATSPLQYIDFVNQFGNELHLRQRQRRPGRATRATASCRRTRARVQRVGSELAGGDLSVLPPELQPPVVLPRSARDVTLLLRGELGYADGYGGKPLPFFKNFYAGGPGSVRGYRPFSLGPQDVVRQRARRQRARSPAAPSCCSRCRAPTATSRCAWRRSSTPARSTRGQKVELGELRFAAGVGAELGLAVRPAASCRSRARSTSRHGDQVQRLQFTLRHRILRLEDDCNDFCSLAALGCAALPRRGAGAAADGQDRLRQHRAHPARVGARRCARRRRSRPSSRSATSELAKVADQLKRMQEDLEKNAVTMTETQRRNKERDFGELNRDFQRKQREFREDLNQRRNEELAQVVRAGERRHPPDRRAGEVRHHLPGSRLREPAHRHHRQGDQGAGSRQAAAAK